MAAAESAEPIAIVGMAALFPGAPDLDRYWQNIVGRVDSIGPVPEDRIDPVFFEPLDEGTGARRSHRFTCRRGGFVDEHATFDPFAHGVIPVAADDLEPDQLLSLRVATEAIDDAGGPAAILGDPARVGVVLGRGGYLTPGLARWNQRIRDVEQAVTVLRDTLPDISEHELQLVRKAYNDRLGPEHPEAVIGMVPNLAASRIANRLDLHGPAYTVDAACASSLLAVDHAVESLRAGRTDLMLAGGTHHCHDLTLWSAFTQLGAMSTAEQIRPFDRRADGLLVGEGTGIVVLKRLADATSDGDRVYAVVRGVGVSSDGGGSSLLNPRVDGQVLAVGRAWTGAGLDPETAGLLEAHGTATPTGDAAELQTLRTVFGEAGDGPRRALGSVKSMIGHAMPAAGMAGLIKTALALHHRVLPPTLHCEEPNPEVAKTSFRLVTEAEPWDASSIRRAGVNAFGFGGINAHVVLEELPSERGVAVHAARARIVASAETEPVVADSERVLLLAGASAADVARQLGIDSGSDDDLLARDDHHATPPAGAVRLAIVDPTPKRLALARRVVEQGKRWHGRNDLWFSPDPLLDGGDEPRVAFLCPGVEPVFDPIVDDLADWFELPRPVIENIDRIGFRGRAVISVGRVLHEALSRCGVSPDLVAGHSIGEWTGMITTEMIPRGEIDQFIETINPAEEDIPDVAYAALGCGAADAQAVLDGLDGVVVSHDNCPHQSIISGPDDAVAEALELLKQRQVLGQVLSFRSGFHTPMFEPHLEPVRGHLARLPLQEPRIPLWSATSCAPYPDDPDAIRALSLRHYVEPVRFRALVERLHDVGVRAFVQLGVGSLTGFVDDTLTNRVALTVAASSAKRSGMQQLRRALAALWSEGHDGTRFDRLVEGSTVADRRSPSNGRRLRLGAPLLRLDGEVQLSSSSRATALRDTDDPLLTELSALLDETTQAGRDVIETLGRRGRPDPGRATRRSPAAEAVPTPEAAASTRRELVVSADEWPWLMDHAFVRMPDGWPSAEDHFPVVPLTTTLALMQQEALRLVPGKVVVGLRDVRALRWIPAAPPTTIVVKAKQLSPDEVRVSFDGYARATVILADEYPIAPPVDPAPLTNEHAPEITARRIYDDRWTFHGPAFQGIVDLASMADDGLRGVIEAPEALGSLMDNALQLLGFWIVYTTEVDRIALPRAVRSIRFFGPEPPPGARVECVIRIGAVEDEYVRADAELVVDGSVWCVIESWDDHRFETDDRLFEMLTWPERRVITEAQPGGWSLVRETWRTSASRDLLVRRFTRASEREEYDARNPRDQRQWLLGRMAVKDCVRHRLIDAGHEVHPIEVEVANDDHGKPYLASAPHGSSDWSVSLAHTDRLAVAIVDERGGPVGIDIETVEPRTRRFESLALTDTEQTYVDGLGDAARDLVLTELWAVKEAAAKAAGTGLEGRPKQFEIVERGEDGLRVGDRWFDTTTIHTEEGAHVVAWTRI